MQTPWIQIVAALGNEGLKNNTTVTLNEFEKFDKEYIFDAVKGQRYGQAFCNKFNITDYILVTTVNIDACKKYIHKIYIR